METKVKSILTGLVMMAGLSAVSQNNQTKPEGSYKVLGNCGMCEKTIEKAAMKKGVIKADWDKNTKVLVLEFDPKKTSADEILKSVADAGYDNEKYTAPKGAYDKLPDCCKYDRSTKASFEK